MPNIPLSRLPKPLLIVISLIMLLGPALPVPTVQAAKPIVSAPFVVVAGVGDQQSPSLAGSTLAYEDCTTPDLCKIKVLDTNSRQSFTAGIERARWFEGYSFPSQELKTDGTRMLWHNYNVTEGDAAELYISNLGDFSQTSLGRNSGEAQVAGNFLVYHQQDELNNAIFLVDLSTGTRTLLSRSGLSPAIDGKNVVWADSRNEKVIGEGEGQTTDGRLDILGYNIATRKEFAVSATHGLVEGPVIWGDNVIYFSGSTPVLSSFSLTTRKTASLRTTPGTKFSLSIWGNTAVWVNLDDSKFGSFDDGIYGIDLASGQEFPIAVDTYAYRRTVSISGNMVVWDETPKPFVNNQGKTDIKGALLSGISTAPVPAPVRPPSTRTFPETQKTVSGLFLDYWYKNGGLAQQGFPISEVMQERSDLDGKNYKVQYFERAVFEEHPENQPPYNVLLSQLGAFRYRAKYPTGVGVPPINKPSSVTGALGDDDNMTHVYAIPVNGERYYAFPSGFSGGTYTFDAIEPGTYYFVSYLVPGPRYISGGYTRAVKCFQANPRANCSDHNLLPVTVLPGETLKDIDVIDLDAAAPPSPPLEGRCQLFKETGVQLCGRFLQYWLTHGDLAQQGFPLSSEVTELSSLTNKTYTVQYFERAVFEYHPENKPPYDVLLSQLGTFRYKEKHPTSH